VFDINEVSVLKPIDEFYRLLSVPFSMAVAGLMTLASLIILIGPFLASNYLILFAEESSTLVKLILSFLKDKLLGIVGVLLLLLILLVVLLKEEIILGREGLRLCEAILATFII
jgi:hypothetical protein